MENLEPILTLASTGVSFLALGLSIILKRKASTIKTAEQIAKEANEKAQKYIAKQCKKYGIDNQTKSVDSQNDNTNTNQNI